MNRKQPQPLSKVKPRPPAPPSPPPPPKAGAGVRGTAAEQKQGAKQAARDFYQAGRINLEMAVWAMKNAGYTREETAEWLELDEAEGNRG
jgi:hypothetical protein